MALTKTVFSLASTFIVLLPIITGVFKYKQMSLPVKHLLFFLMLGFVVDVSFLCINKEYRSWVLSFYGLAEALFYFYFLHTICGNNTVKKICIVLACLNALIWLIQVIYFRTDSGHIAFFEIFYRMVISILSGFIILLMIERDTNIFHSHLFWLVGAVFFYCTCSFFAFAFMHSEIANRIWFLHNIVNIMACFLFFKGMLLVKSENE